MSHRALVADTAKNAWPGFQIIEKIVKKHWFAAIWVFEEIQVVLVNGKKESFSLRWITEWPKIRGHLRLEDSYHILYIFLQGVKNTKIINSVTGGDLKLALHGKKLQNMAIEEDKM